MLPALKSQALLNLKKAHSLIEKITTMVEEDDYCISVMQQNLALLGLLKSAQQMFMENHLKTCFKEAMGARDEKKREAMIKETLQVTKWNGK